MQQHKKLPKTSSFTYDFVHTLRRRRSWWIYTYTYNNVFINWEIPIVNVFKLMQMVFRAIKKDHFR